MIDFSNFIASQQKIILKYFFHTLKLYKSGMALYFLLLIAGVVLQIPIPFYLKKMIDSVASKNATEHVMYYAAIFSSLAIAGLLISVIATYVAAKITKNYTLQLKMQLFESVQQSDSHKIAAFQHTDILSRATRDVDSLAFLTPVGIISASRNIIFSICFYCVLLSMSWKLALLILILLPIAAMILYGFKPYMEKFSRESHIAYANSNAALLEGIKSTREALVTNTQNFHSDRLKRVLVENENKKINIKILNSILVSLLSLIPVIATFLIWYVGAVIAESNSMTIGGIMSFMFILSMLYSPIQNLLNVSNHYSFEITALERVCEIINLDRLNKSVSKNAMFDNNSKIHFKNIHFSYEGKEIFNDFTFIVRGGKCNLIVGENGSGKTTLISLLLGFLTPSSGNITIDSSSEFNFHNISCGYVPQEIFIYNDTLRNNILLGRIASDNCILNISKSIGLKIFTDYLQDDLDYFIEENGKNLSGGQRQKIAIIRALINDPSILILDEPDNNLDAESYRQLIKFLEMQKEKRTVILVSHDIFDKTVVDHVIELPAL